MKASAAVADHAASAERVQAPQRVLQPFQIRVIEEKQELDGRIERLGEFVAGPLFKGLDALERARMRKQLALMSELSIVLGARIAAFDRS